MSCKLTVLGEFLAMHVDEKTEDLVAEKEEKMKYPQLKNNSALPKPVHRISLIDQVTVRSSRKVNIEWEKVQVELMREKSEKREVDKAIREKQHYLKQLKEDLEIENDVSKQLLERADKKSVDAGILFEKANKSKRETTSAIEILTEDQKALKSETTRLQGTLTEYKRYSNILFTLSPPDRREASKAKGKSDAQDEQNKPHESAIKQGLKSSPGRVLPSTEEPTLSSANSNTSVPGTVSLFPLLQEKPELCFSDPQQLLEVVTELTEQNLSLIEHSTRADRTVEMFRQATKNTAKKNKEEDEKLTSPLNDMKDRLDNEKERAANLQKKVQLHEALKTKDQDVMLDALAVKVTEVYSSCVDKRLTNLSTLEKLSCIEYQNFSLLQQIEDIPEEHLKTLWQIKDSKRKSRLHAEQLRLEREREKKVKEKCKKRSQSHIKKKSGRKLMPRCIPVERKIKVGEDDNTAEDELRSYLFSTEDAE